MNPNHACSALHPSSPILSKNLRGKAPSRSRARTSKYILIAVTIAAILLAHFLRRTYGFHLVHDSHAYYILSKALAQTGLFHFSDPKALPPGADCLLQVRTYGYPLFLALCKLFTSDDVKTFQLAVFWIQLFLYLGMMYLGSRIIAASVRAPRLTSPLYLCTALNPWLLVHCSDLLTDFLSAALIYLNFSLLLRSCIAPEKDKEGGPVGLWGTTGLLFFLLGFSVMLRPANLILAPATFALWSVTAYRRSGKHLLALPVLALIFAIPFIPQVANNYAISGKLRPLVIQDIYQGTSPWGIRYITAAASSDGVSPWLFIHRNPYVNSSLPDEELAPQRFRRQHPRSYLLTCAAHALFLFNQDTPFTYLKASTSWYRWPSSFFSFAFLGLALYGICVAARRAWRRGLSDRLSFAVMVALILSGSYVAIYLPMPIETRYAIPLYLLLALFVVMGLARLGKLFALGCYVQVGIFAVWLVAFLACCISLSSWLDRFAEIVRIG
jgi:hypothetical protein